MLSNYICCINFRCSQCGIFFKNRYSLAYHLRNTSHVFGPGGRKYVTPTDVQATADNSNDRHKSRSSHRPSKHSEQQPTSSSSITASQQQAFNDHDSRPSSSTTEARQRASPHVSSKTATSSLSAVLEHTNRDNECIFYDYKAVSDERPLLNLSNSPTCSCKPIWAYCRFAAGSRIPAASCLPSDYPQFTGSTAMRSCCRRLCFRSSCAMNAATPCFLQK